jgi:hypothetical protein
MFKPNSGTLMTDMRHIGNRLDIGGQNVHKHCLCDAFVPTKITPALIYGSQLAGIWMTMDDITVCPHTGVLCLCFVFCVTCL